MTGPAQLPVDAATLQLLSDRVRAQLGLHFPPERLADLERGLRGAARDFEFHGADATLRCAQWLVSAELSAGQIDTLARHLTIGETYFFRDPAIFELLRLRVLPALIAQKKIRGEKSLRLWCAACCTGEEPYSLAMLLAQAMPALTPDWRDWQLQLLGTDLNPQFLAKARAGIYGQWSFRESARDEQRAFFTPTSDGRFQLRRNIRDMVRFAQLNLITSEFPASANGTMQQDIIFCRNVLIYFTKEQSKNVAGKLAACLAEGGYLVPSASEASPQVFGTLQVQHHPGAILYRKVSHAVQTSSPRRAAPRVPVPARPKSSTPPKPRPPAQPDAKALALAAFADGDRAAALHWCDVALAADKMNAAMHLMRATLLEETDQAGAELSLGKALYLEPDHADAHVRVARLALRRGHKPAAKKAFNTALRILVSQEPDALVSGTRQTTAELAEEVAGVLEGFDDK